MFKYRVKKLWYMLLGGSIVPGLVWLANTVPTERGTRLAMLVSLTIIFAWGAGTAAGKKPRD